MQSAAFTDREMLTDALHAQKQSTDAYNLFAGECASKALKDEMMSLLNEEHDIQYDVYSAMHTRGWYPVPSAQPTAIDQARQTYPKQ